MGCVDEVVAHSNANNSDCRNGLQGTHCRVDKSHISRQTNIIAICRSSHGEPLTTWVCCPVLLDTVELTKCSPARSPRRCAL